MSVSPNSRTVAAGLLGMVLERGRPLDEALADAKSGFRDLSDRDRAFVRRLVATALRRRGQIDAVLRGFLSLWPKGRPGQALRVGTAELLFLETPPHAAVHGAVETLPPDQSRARGLVNAVLRRVANEGKSVTAAQDAARLNTPGWLWQSWTAAYGEAAARAIAQAHLQEAPLDISVQSDVHGWANILEAEVLPTGSLRRMAPGAVDTLPGYAEGGWWIQDAAAALPARLLGDLQHRTVADLCAAPGGKTIQLAVAGGAVTAIDRSEARLDRLRQNLERMRVMAAIVTADIETWLPPEAFDAVLLDAPCSATGTIRRHPDLPHLKSEADVAKLSQLQRRLISQAWTMLRPEGRMVYCVCSLQPEEGEQHLDALRALPGAKLLPVDAAKLGLPAEAVTKDGCLRTLPSMWAERGGMDGFFAVCLQKT
ncbi:transcription antitermination factor NusB [uncultured Ferrovibrio sp.]|jgi:16S rRNA (cytosine967-C5)-methyltransferase|uniref:RsmB/NOP family class I SAM-dependent RNA methyltransferase n=1 Tax=uncultured Ferrovibrio sp. TaxID=1576913 RepID=UPI0026067BCA|nr:transcription antitermination factor NusB [uncultured Ferrovibrio sp.]